VISSGPAERTARGQAEVELALPGGQPPPGRGLQRLHLGLVARRAQMLDAPRPSTREYTICTAVAPDAVRTVRT
jgi:hypothetical protein